MDLKVSGSMNPKLFEALNKFMEEKKPQNEKEANKFMQEFIELYNNDKLNYEYSPAVKASEILEKVEDAKSDEERIKLAHEALEIDANCLEAKIIIAVNQDRPIKVLSDVDSALKEERARLKEEGFFDKDNIGEFYGIFETRAYIQNMYHLAHMYANAGMIKRSIDVAREVIRLNENDNTGVRYLLMGLYAYLEDEVNMKKLYNKYREENVLILTPFMIYYYKQGKYEEAVKYLERIKRVNKNFVSFFQNEYDINLPDGYMFGDVSEVQTIVSELDFLFITVTRIEDFILNGGL